MTSALTLETIQVKAATLSDEIKIADASLRLLFVVHRQGQLQNTLHLMEDLILDHPAGLIARQIITRIKDDKEPLGLLGVATDAKGYWITPPTPNILAIIAINTDLYKGFDDVLFGLYHHTWHAIEMAEYCHQPDIVKKIRGRPLLPKAKQTGQGRSNLCADIFSAIMMSTDGHGDAVEKLANLRGIQALSREIQAKPELYPYIIASESVRFALDQTYGKLDKNASRFERATDIAREISLATTDTQIDLWQRFAEGTQDLAWRGYTHKEILSIAAYHSEDPYMRALAHQVAEATKINVSTARESLAQYNPFNRLGASEQEHQDQCTTSLEESLSKVLKDGNSDALRQRAHQQNHDLAKGKFLGWCAKALFACARAFDHAIAQGIPPEQAVRIEFSTHRQVIPLALLQKIGQEVVIRQRRGQTTDVAKLLSMIKHAKNCESLAETIELTVTDDSHQEKSLADLNISKMIAQPFRPEPRITAEIEKITIQSQKSLLHDESLIPTETPATKKLSDPKPPSPTLSLEDDNDQEKFWQ